MLRSMAALLWSILVGCTQPWKEQDYPMWDDAAAVCPLTAPDGGAPVAGHSTMQPVSAECATWVGDNFELDWESFGEEARAFTQPISPAERTVAGLVVAFGTSGVTIGEVLGQGAPEQLGEQLSAYAALNSFEASDDAARLWFEFLYWKIAEIRYVPELDSLMAYDDKTILVGDVAGLFDNGDNDGIAFYNPAYSAEVIASMLVHEATHDVVPGHSYCSAEADEANEQPACDATENGAYGAGLWWTWTWLAKNAVRLDEGECGDAVSSARSWCGRILDAGDFPACTFETDPCA